MGEAGCGGVMEAAPWLFSERDVRDLMRLKKPLFLDSRFLSVPSCVLVDGPLTEGSLEKMKNNNVIKKNKKKTNLYSGKDFHIVRKIFYTYDTRLYFNLHQEMFYVSQH